MNFFVDFCQVKARGRDSFVQIGFLYLENTGIALGSAFATLQEFAVTLVVCWRKRWGIEVLQVSTGTLSNSDELESLSVASCHHGFYLLLMSELGSQNTPYGRENVNLT